MDENEAKEIIRELQDVQAALERQNGRTPDVNLMPEIDRIREVTGRVSNLLHGDGGGSGNEPNEHQTANAGEEEDEFPRIVSGSASDPVPAGGSFA